MKVSRFIAVALAGLALPCLGCQLYVAKKQEEVKQHFLKLAEDDQVCRSTVETTFARCWNEGMAKLDDRDGIKTIVACLNAAAGKDCFELPARK